MAWSGARRSRTYLLLATALAAAYGALWIAIDYLMERSFNLHIWDAGANYVLTAMTSQPDLDYGHLTSAPQNPIYLFFTPLTRAFPDPMPLIYSQDVLMALGGIFLYLIARDAWNSEPRALLVEGLYLFNYSLFGAPFYPDHYEVLFSVFFPIAYFFLRRDRTLLTAVFLVLAALCSSLGAVTTGLFVVLILAPRFLSELRGRGTGLLRFFADHSFLLAAGVGSVVIFVFPFLVQGTGTTLSYAHLSGSPTSPNLLGGLEFDLPEKIAYVLLVVVPFVPVIRRSRYVLLTLPYAALALLSGSNHYIQFSYQYTYTIGAILFISWIEALRPRYSQCPWPRTTGLVPSPDARRGKWRLPGRIARDRSLIQLTAIAAVLGFFALPYSPGNAWAGTYTSLPFHDYGFRSLVTITAYDQALWTMAGEIPRNSSVLIQENMPMLTNRATWYEPGSYAGERVQYVLADPSTFWFIFSPPAFIGPYTIPMIYWVNELHNNASYGIVREYEGATLLERGYNGSLESFAPYESYEPGVAFVGPNATYPGTPAGVIHIRTNTSGSGLLHTEGALVLPPGQYRMTYWFSAVHATASQHLTLGLWENETDPRPYLTVPISGSNLSSSGAWTPITITFSLPAYVEGLFFAAATGQWDGNLSMASVYLNQTTPG